jgi:hypothetical protein
MSNYGVLRVLIVVCFAPCGPGWGSEPGIRVISPGCRAGGSW